MSKGLPRARKASSKSSVRLTVRVLKSLGLQRTAADNPAAKGPKGFGSKARKEERKGLLKFLPTKK